LVVASFNYFSAFILIKHLFKNNYAAVTGAFIFAFSIALESQLTHAQTFPRFAIPLAFYFGIRFEETYDPKFFFFSILALVYQFYCGIYLGFLLAVPLGIYLNLILLKIVFQPKRTPINFNWILNIAGSIALNILLLFLLMAPYVERSIPPTEDHFTEILTTIPTLSSYFFSLERSLIWGFLSNIGKDQEAWYDHQIFTGLIATLSFLICTFWVIHKLIKVKLRLPQLPHFHLLTLTGLCTFIVFLRIGDNTLYEYIYALPGYSSMRSLTRIINIQLIFFAIGIAAITNWITNKFNQKSFSVFIIAISVIILDNAYITNNSTKVEDSHQGTSKIEKAFAILPEKSVVSYEPSKLESSSPHYHLDAMLTAQKNNLIILNAYTATSPVDFDAYWHLPNEFNRNYWLGEKALEFDTLYVVSDKNSIEKIPLETLLKALPNAEEKALIKDMNYMRTDENWMKSIREKAEKKNISVDSMLYLDAVWIRDNT
jgi:hypothetical protein